MSDNQPVLVFTQSNVKAGMAASYAEYLKGTFLLMAEVGAEVVAVGGGLAHERATHHYKNNAVLKFPSREAMEQMFADPRYAALKPLYDASLADLHVSYVLPRQPVVNPEAVARKAFEAFTHGLTQGQWQGFFDMLTDDFTFWFPKGKFKGEHHGKAKAVEFFTFVSQVVTDLKIHFERMAGNGNIFFFEFQDEGQLRGQPYQNRIVISMEVRGDKLCGYREYFGWEGKKCQVSSFARVR